MLPPCAADPTPSVVGGPAPYWRSWTFDRAGNRKTETEHSLSGDADTVRAYVYPAQGQGQNRPHSVTRVDQANGASLSYGYDDSGNTMNRPGHTMTWDPEARMATSRPGSGEATSYVYDSNGNRLVRKEPGANTIYLRDMELRYDTASKTLTATRFYSFDGSRVAVRTGKGVHFQVADHQGTNVASVDAATGQITLRRFLPYGDVRAVTQASAFPHDKGFVGGTNDPTGLTHVGAREYDPALGRFLSVDPLINTSDPQSLSNYGYAKNSPVTLSDPTGLCIPDDHTGECIPGTRGRSGGGSTTPHCTGTPDRCADQSGQNGQIYPCTSRSPDRCDDQNTRNRRGGPSLRLATQPDDPLPPCNKPGGLFCRPDPSWPLPECKPQDPRVCDVPDDVLHPEESDYESNGTARDVADVAAALAWAAVVKVTDGWYSELTGCFIVCYGIQATNDGFAFVAGGIGCCGPAFTVGRNSAPDRDTHGGTLGVCASGGAGGCLQTGFRKDGTRYWGGGVTFGTGGFAGVMGSFPPPWEWFG